MAQSEFTSGPVRELSPSELGVDGYTDIELLSDSGHNRVYRAMHAGKWVVLKIAREDEGNATRNRLLLQREYDIMHAIDCIYVVNTWQIADIPGLGRAIVMEYVQGRTFHQFVQEKPSLSVRKRVAEELMEALETLHAHQIVHGDLKQDNILITDVGNHVRLIDFGFADTDAYIAKIAIAQDNEAYTRMVEHLFPGRLNYLVRLAVLRRWRLTWLVPLIMIACMVAAAIIYMRPVYKGTADVQPATIADTTQRDMQKDTVVVAQRVVRRDTVVVTQQVVRRDTVMVSAPEDETWTGIKKELDVSCKSLYDLYADSITNMPEKEYDKAFELHHAYAMRMFDLKQQLSADYPQYEEQIEGEYIKLYGIGYSKLSQIFRYYPYVIRK